MNDLAQYNAERMKLRAGDIVLFWGKSPLSFLIEMFASGPSHCAIVRQPATDWADAVIEESTIEGAHNGVQQNPLGARIAGYDKGGRVTALCLSDETRARLNWEKFYAFIGAAQDHISYDVEGLFEFLAREVPVLGCRVGQEEHKNTMVCSAFVTATLEACGVLCGINWAKVRPQDLVEMKLYSESIPLLGEQKLLRFNTV